MSSDMSRRLNQGRLYFLLNFVENSNHLNYYYVKKNRNLSCEYQMLGEELLEMEEDCFQFLQPMMERLLVTFKGGILLDQHCNWRMSHLLGLYLEQTIP